jgi:8-oxo-dGTP diphosphatase
MLPVVAVVIESEGKVLVCQRQRGTMFELKWEFPGGKLQAGETPAQDLARQLREELGVEAVIGTELYRTRHSYQQLGEPLAVIFLAAKRDSSSVQNIVFESRER